MVALKPDWPKGYSRLGAAHFGLRAFQAASDAYSKGEKRKRGVIGSLEDVCHAPPNHSCWAARV